MRLLRSACKEICLLRHILFDVRSYFLAKLALVVGFSYLFVPLDIIPDRIPYFGHVDEATSVISGFLIARLLAQPQDHDHDLDAVPAPSLVRHPTPVGGHRQTPRLFLLLGYRGWWFVNAPLARRRSTLRGLVVMGGAARSGTTLLRGTMGRHPLIASLPETTVFLHRITSARHLGQRLGWNPVLIEQWQARSRSQVEFIERVHRAVVAEFGRPVWLEKTPANVLRFGFVRRSFPQAKLVHVIRDGRDVVSSLRWKPWAKIPRDIPRASPEAARRCG
ncbi:MAG TPA: sulfotransferase, partial [Acetobacteraceae bacterium]